MYEGPSFILFLFIEWWRNHELRKIWNHKDYINNLTKKICVKEKKPFEILHEQIVNAKQGKLDKHKNGFQLGWHLEEIIDARLHEKKQQFLVKWKQSEETEFIDAVFMKENYPQAVIAFYQASIIWSRDHEKFIFSS